MRRRPDARHRPAAGCCSHDHGDRRVLGLRTGELRRRARRVARANGRGRSGHRGPAQSQPPASAVAPVGPGAARAATPGGSPTPTANRSSQASSPSAGARRLGAGPRAPTLPSTWPDAHPRNVGPRRSPVVGLPAPSFARPTLRRRPPIGVTPAGLGSDLRLRSSRGHLARRRGPGSVGSGSSASPRSCAHRLGTPHGASRGDPGRDDGWCDRRRR